MTLLIQMIAPLLACVACAVMGIFCGYQIRKYREMKTAESMAKAAHDRIDEVNRKMCNHLKQIHQIYDAAGW
jgi:predicted small metal-binding protein